MTQTEKRALFTLAVWGCAAASLAAVFFGGGGPEAFGVERLRVLATAVLIGCGFLAYFLMLWLTRSRPGAKPMIADERDERIAARASVTTLVVVLSIVYLACIVLWEVCRQAGCVPVGWMWFLGYATVILAYLCHATATLLLHHGMGGHGQS